MLRGDEYELLEVLPGAVIAADQEGFILWANSEACDLLNYDHPDDLVAKPLTSLIPKRFTRRHEAGFHRYITTGRSRLLGRRIQVRALAQSGQEIPVELCLRMFRRPDGTDLLIGAMQRAVPSQDMIDFSVIALEEELTARDYEAH